MLRLYKQANMVPQFFNAEMWKDEVLPSSDRIEAGVTLHDAEE